MGYHAHHAIVVTGFDEKGIKRARAAVAKIVPTTTPLTPRGINGFRSFLVPPDGSKEGWVASDMGDERRCQIRALLESKREEWFADYVEVRFGGDEPERCEIVAFRRR